MRGAIGMAVTTMMRHTVIFIHVALVDGPIKKYWVFIFI